MPTDNVMIPEEVKAYYPTNVGLRALTFKDCLIVWVILGKNLKSVDHWRNFMGTWEKCDAKRH